MISFIRHWKITKTNRPFARWRHFTTTTGILQGQCFLVQIKAFVNKTSLGLPNLNMKGKTKWILVLVVKRRHRANGPLEPFSGRESQDIYCWLEKFKNQFKSRGHKLDSAWLAFSWARNLTGLAKTFYFSLEPETRNMEFIDTTCRRLGEGLNGVNS